MICIVCNEPADHCICGPCLAQMAKMVEDRRNGIVNQAMSDLDQEATKIAELDPTKGRGRGPQWLG